MSRLLDTDVVIGLLDEARGPTLYARVAAEPPGSVVTSVVVAHELYFGAARSPRRAHNERRLDVLFRDLPVLPFTREDAAAAGDMRAALRAAGAPIGSYDELIAGQALARGLVLATANAREFGRVEGLVVED